MFSRLDKFLRRKYGEIPQSALQKALRKGMIKVNKRRAKAGDRVSEQDDIFVAPVVLKMFRCAPPEAPRSIPPYSHSFRDMIIYEDEDIIAVDKPAGLAVQLGTKTKVSLDVLAKSYDPALRLVHRLDKETSGVIIMAKNLLSARHMLYLFQSKRIIKKYLLVTSRKIKQNCGIIDAPLLRTKTGVVVNYELGQRAETRYELIRHFAGRSFVQAWPKTGRNHQIRAHFAHIGASILGDAKYKGQPFEHLCLHSNEIRFQTLRGENLTITSAVPAYFPA